MVPEGIPNKSVNVRRYVPFSQDSDGTVSSRQELQTARLIVCNTRTNTLVEISDPCEYIVEKGCYRTLSSIPDVLLRFVFVSQAWPQTWEQNQLTVALFKQGLPLSSVWVWAGTSTHAEEMF